MSKVSVFDRGWIDLVFEGRNKSYGAYQLRRDDSKTTMIALFTGIALLFAAVSIPVAVNYLKKDTAVMPAPEGTIVLTEIMPPVAEPPKPEPAPQQQQQATAAPASSTPTVKFTPPVVTQTAPADLPTIDDFDNANPGSSDNPGDSQAAIVIGPSGTDEGTPGGTGTAPEGHEGPVLPGTLDVAPAFPGGLEAFYKKVGREFDTPETLTKTTLKVFVTFVVEKDGTMTGIKALNDPGHGIGREAVRVLKSIKAKWKPGIKCGKPVRTAYTLPIIVNAN